MPGVAGASENAFRVAPEPQARSKVPPEMPSVSLRCPKCARKWCSGLLRSCLTLPNAARACSGAACALETAAWAGPKAARSLEKLVRASSATALLSNSCADHHEFGMGLKFNVLLEIVVRKGSSEITIRSTARNYCSKSPVSATLYSHPLPAVLLANQSCQVAGKTCPSQLRNRIAFKQFCGSS